MVRFASYWIGIFESIWELTICWVITSWVDLFFSFEFLFTWIERTSMNFNYWMDSGIYLFGCSNFCCCSAFSSICLLFSFLNLKSSIHVYCFISIAKCTFTLFHFEPFICATQYKVIRRTQSTKINTVICIAEPCGIGIVDKFVSDVTKNADDFLFKCMTN